METVFHNQYKSISIYFCILIKRTDPKQWNLSQVLN